ncbi:MAG TPA: MarR family transcriptional regulator [Firmicutes bacterium]|jgi:DNA-binding MarR family transcriptional regulator|nr:MarR family transcriptional regulator [Bacillota bacterium]
MSESRKTVIEQMMQLQMLLHRYQIQNFMFFGPWGNPNRGQGRVLSILKMKPEISQKELGYLLNMSKQSLAEILGKLEKKGYLIKETSDEDKRSFNIKLTEKGATIAGDMDDTSTDLQNLFEGFRDEELANFSEYLNRIIERLKEQFTGVDDDLRQQMMERFMEQHHLLFRGHDHWFDRHDRMGFFGGKILNKRHRQHDDDPNEDK